MASPVPTTVRVFQTDSGHSSQHEASEREAGPDLTASNSSSRDISDNQMLESQPLPKRRRVTRACDECRRKRIKCDGKHPCTHCTVYSYECTYNQPSNRRRNASPQSIKALETQLKRAKALMQVVLPTVDLSDPSIDAQLQSGLLLPLPMGPSQPKVMPAFQLEAMLPGLSQLDLNEEEIWNYHGSSLDRLPYLRHRSTSRAARPPSPIQSPAGWSTAPSPGIDLPSMEEARLICDHTILNVSIMLSAVHLPTFHKQLERIYTMSPENYESAENSFLPLLYAVLALGKAFAKRDNESDVASCDALVDEGFLYFNASRELLDITDCRDLTSLQAIIFMIQFLQLSAKLSTCYAYIGVALRSALCMGLHLPLDARFTMIEAETRKRAFWIIRRMDTHVGAMLGLPRFLEDQDIDQEWPSEVDDEYITQTEISLMPEGNVSVMAAFNAHTRLVQVLNKICRYVYPLKGTRSGGEYPKTHTVSHFKIQELEQELAQWLDELPMALKLGGEAPPNTIRVQQLLRMAFGHAQLLLYRPFLHYASQSYKHKTVDQTASACASACVGVSRNIIHIGTEMRWQGLLAESFWFSSYTIFFAVVSILYLVLQDPTSPTSFELLRDAMKGRKMLAFLAKRSAAADRCSNALKGMFEKLPKSARSDEETVESKKRRRGTSPLFLAVGPNLPKRDGFMGPHHVSTFSESVPCSKRTAHHRSLPIPQPRPVSPGWKPTYNFPWPMNRDFLSTMPGCSPTGTADQSPGEAWSDQQNYEAW